MNLDLIELDNVSRFYGEVLGVNRVTLSLPPGITSLVGPNGAGKTTLLNLMTGLVRPTRGRVHVLGISPSQPHRLFRCVGYSTQFDAFPKGLTGFQFIYSFLRLFGTPSAECKRLTALAIEQAGLSKHPQAKKLRQIPGIGPITSLAFVLMIEDPNRFEDPRDVGAYLGLAPGRDQSGDMDKELSISKTGNPYLRRLLVQSAQYILGCWGKVAVAVIKPEPGTLG